MNDKLKDFYTEYPDKFLDEYLDIKLTWFQKIIIRLFNLKKTTTTNKQSIKILKHGIYKKEKHTIKFKCEYCGCVYKTNKYKYKYIENIYTYNNIFIYSCCPECNNLIIKDVNINNE